MWLRVGKLVTDWYLSKKVLTHLTVESRELSGSFAVQMMNTLQGQHHDLNQEISRLTAENQQFRQAGSPGLAEIATTVGQAVQTAISNANTRSNERQRLVDIKGFGKPLMFEGESEKFIEWPNKTTGVLIWLSFPISDRMGGRSRQRHHE